MMQLIGGITDPKPMINYVRTSLLPRRWVQLLVQTASTWQREDCSRMSAALSYYALFSLFPILLVILSVLGSFLGPGTDAVQYIEDVIDQFLPPDAQALVITTMQNLYGARLGAGLIGFGLLLYSASTVFGVLSSSVDQIWQPEEDASEKTGGLKQSVLAYLTGQATAFLLVLAIALLLLVSMASNLVISALVNLTNQVNTLLPNLPLANLPLASGLHLGSSFFILALAVLGLIRVLPARHIPWQDIWPAALLTAALLVGLQRLVSTSVISLGEQYLSYGVIGGVMILLLWIYFTCQIFFVGCAFSHSYARLFGSQRHRYTQADVAIEADGMQ
jgi:membrane protein